MGHTLENHSSPGRPRFHCSDLWETCKTHAAWGGAAASQAPLAWQSPCRESAVFGKPLRATAGPAARTAAVVFQKCFGRLSKGTPGWGSERRGAGLETASLFLASPERLPDGYCWGSAESEASPSCSPETQLLGENNHSAEHRSIVHLPEKRAENLKTKEKSTKQEALSKTHGGGSRSQAHGSPRRPQQEEERALTASPLLPDQALNPGACRCDRIWEKGLCRCT